MKMNNLFSFFQVSGNIRMRVIAYWLTLSVSLTFIFYYHKSCRIVITIHIFYFHLFVNFSITLLPVSHVNSIRFLQVLICHSLNLFNSFLSYSRYITKFIWVFQSGFAMRLPSHEHNTETFKRVIACNMFAWKSLAFPFLTSCLQFITIYF